MTTLLPICRMHLCYISDTYFVPAARRRGWQRINSCSTSDVWASDPAVFFRYHSLKLCIGNPSWTSVQRFVWYSQRMVTYMKLWNLQPTVGYSEDTVHCTAVFVFCEYSLPTPQSDCWPTPLFIYMQNNTWMWRTKSLRSNHQTNIINNKTALCS